MAQTVNSQKAAHPVNYMEELAESVLDNLLLEYKGIRFSSGAVRDIKAMALNRLWPMYTTSERGRGFLRKMIAQDRVEKDVTRELRAAIDIVRSHPR